MISYHAVQDAIEDAKAMQGAPYLLGSKWEPLTRFPCSRQDWPARPAGPVDCSGYARWVLGRAGLVIPDGTWHQIRHCRKLELAVPRPLDLGFADLDGSGEPDHVVVALDAENVIEARGCSKHTGHSAGTCPFGRVVIRPVAKWNAQKGFLGWYFVPGVYEFVGPIRTEDA